MTNKEREKLEKFRELLSEDSSIMIAYKEKQKVYQDAARKYKEAEMAFNKAESVEAVNTWRFMESNLRLTVTLALDEWVTIGYKNEVESMMAYINQVMQRQAE